MPTCPNGHEVDHDVAFCHQCGDRLGAYDEPTVVLAPVPTAPPAQARPAPSNTAVYALAASIVVIGLVAIGLALVLGSRGNSGRPTPTTQPTASVPTGGSSPSSSPRGSTSPTGATVPVGGTTCPGTVDGGGAFGTIGPETSCGFVQAVYRSYVDTVGLHQAQGQTATISATSPTTHKTYDNIACTVDASWVTCVGGNKNTARMFFAHP